jgi:hypothetical protein
MKPPYRFLALQALVLGYVLFFRAELISAPFLYGRLLLLFLAGTVVTLFVQGPQYGIIDPTSTRPLMVALGVVAMGASLLWSFVIRGHL